MQIISAFIKDGDCLQMGIASVLDAVIALPLTASKVAISRIVAVLSEGVVTTRSCPIYCN